MLFQAVKKYSNSIALITNSDLYRYSFFELLYEKNAETLSRLEKSSIAIIGTTVDLVMLLPVLHEKVASIFLVSSSLDAEIKDKLYKQLRVSVELSLKGEKIIASPVLQDAFSCNNSTLTQWCIATSGTTGMPKIVQHSFSSLIRTVKLDNSVGSKIIWGLTYDVTRFAGIQVFLQSFLSGSTLVIPDNQDEFTNQIDFFVAMKCSALSATPSYWRKILMHKKSNDLPLRYVTLGGEIADQNILDNLASRFPKAKITHIYASTEVGVGFPVKDAIEGFPAAYLEGLDGIEMKIHDSYLFLKPDKVLPEVISGKVDIDSEGYINTGDMVVLDKERVKFLGRASGSINIGGNKVLPEEIESCIKSSGLVMNVKAYGIQSSIMGEIVAADIVPIKLENKLIKKQVVEYCKAKLDRYKVPAFIKIVSNIELNSSGKVLR